MTQQNNSFCPLLFQHLATHPVGSISFCCISDHTNGVSHSRDFNPPKVYNLYKDKIIDIYNGENFRQARLTILDGKTPAPCMVCERNENAGIESKRQQERDKMYPSFTKEFAQSITDENGYIAEENLNFEYIELRLGNVCNVACRTCNPYSSSKWAPDYDKLSAVNKSFPQFQAHASYRWPEIDAFWLDLEKYIKNVKVIYINGGEPTLIKQHITFLNRLSSVVNKDIELRYNINATNLDEEIIEVWNKFNHVNVQCSIDDLDIRNEYIRHPTKWKSVLKTLDRLQQEKFDTAITQTVSFMNYSSIPEFYKFFKARNIKIFHNFVYQPHWMSPNVLPKAFRDEVHVRFRKELPSYMADNLIKGCSAEHNEADWDKAREFTKQLDVIRNQNIVDYLPEFKDLM